MDEKAAAHGVIAAGKGAGFRLAYGSLKCEITTRAISTAAVNGMPGQIELARLGYDDRKEGGDQNHS
jgi:hypothetical protein